MIQEVKDGFTNTNKNRMLPLYDRSTPRSLRVDLPATLAPVHIHKKIGPRIPENAILNPPAANNEIYVKILQEYRVWFLARVIGSHEEKQLVPGFGGFVPATGNKPTSKSTIDFFSPINHPFTEYSTIKELLRQSEDATKEVGQEYILNTFDLGGCMKALPLIWKFSDEYKKHIVTPGPFHTGMNYMGMITAHKCKGSGYGKILVEAGLVTSGYLVGVLSGKSYAKALFCLTTVTEAMERLLIEQFLEDEHVESISSSSMLSLVHECSRETLNIALQDRDTCAILAKYTAYEDKVRVSHLGKTAAFWITIIDHARLVLLLQYSVKTNNLTLFHKCNGEMANLFFAYDGPNYSRYQLLHFFSSVRSLYRNLMFFTYILVCFHRYLTWYEMFLTNIDQTHPGAKELLSKGGIAVARSLIPGALSAVDKTMEETFMKFAKSQGRPQLRI